MMQMYNAGFCYAHVRAVTAVVQIACAPELHLAVAWLTNSRIRHMTEHAHCTVWSNPQVGVIGNGPASIA